jgi:MoxR-like ATPase
VTYPDPAVIRAITAAFVPLRLQLGDRHVRDLNIVWLPTVVILDHRGREHYRNVNAAPPEDFLDVLALSEAHARLKDARTESHTRAEAVLETALSRRPDGPLHPELVYWLAIAGYFRGHHDGEIRDRVWGELRRRYPDSAWAHRVPEYMIERGRQTTPE